jgi:hypothetical protein
MSRKWIGVVVVFGVAGVFAQPGTPAAAGANDQPTFVDDVAPIVFNNCTTCHRPGEAAPFSLTNYQETKSRGRLIASMTANGKMPPWKAAPSDFAFKNERHLTEDQKAVLQRWVANGMPEGDRQKTPALPTFTAGWQLGTPDLVVKMPEPFSVPADGPDIYRNFVVPLNLAEDRWVRAVDFRPSARAVVHHSLFFLDATGGARVRDAEDPLPGFDGSMGLGGRGFLPGGAGRGARGAAAAAPQAVGVDAGVLDRLAGGLGGWALGGRARELPAGLAFFVPKGADLILSTHFHPSGKQEHEASTVGIYFADKPPVHPFSAVQLPPAFGALEGLDIAPGDAQYMLRDSFVLPVDVKAFAAGAHAHYLAKDMKLTATLPSGETRTLLWINDWDFSWQDVYTFEDYVALPKGTRLDVTIRYDNSTDNPRNPSQPPKRVLWGEESFDEMGGMAIQVIAADDAELPALRAAYVAHVREAARTRPGLRQLIQRRLLSGGPANQPR